MIEKLGKIWAHAIAYVALFLSAGLSIAGNVADTFRVRGEATDILDVILAGAAPALVLLTVELFVSQLWSRSLGYQVLRWIGCMGIGALAMGVSWVHLNDLLSSRGQMDIVATAWPFAIDGMAIMATGLLLSTRGKGRPGLAAAMSTAVSDVLDTFDPAGPRTPYVATEEDARVSADIMANPMDYVSPSSQEGRDAEDSVWQGLVGRLGGQGEPTLPAPVSPAPVGSNRVRPESVPAEAAALILTWLGAPADSRPTPGEADALVAGALGRHPRTARRWRDAVTAEALNA